MHPFRRSRRETGLMIPHPMKAVPLFSILISVFLLCCFGAGCSGDPVPISGKWTVAGVVIDDIEHSDAEPLQNYGDTAYQWKDATLTFSESGNVVLHRPTIPDGGMTDVAGTYTLQDQIIEICDPDDPTDFTLLEYRDGKIYFDLFGSGTVLVFSR